MYSQLEKLLTFDDIRGVLLSSKHSGGKYLQIQKKKRMHKEVLLKQMLKDYGNMKGASKFEVY